MKAIQVASFDERFADISIIDTPPPEPRPGEVLLRVERAGIFPADILTLRGRYMVRREVPFVAGLLGVGEVVGHGGGLLPRLMRGRRVFFGTQPERGGTWAEYAVADAKGCLPVGDLPVELAIDLGNSLTAVGLLHSARKRGARALLMNAAAGSLGRQMNALAASEGFPLLNVVRSSQQAEILGRLGARHVLDQTLDGFIERLRHTSHQLGATFAIDSIGGPVPKELMETLPEGSTIVSIGNLSGQPVTIDPVEDMMGRQQRFEVFVISRWLGELGLAARLRAARTAKRLVSPAESSSATVRTVSLREVEASLGDLIAQTSTQRAIIDPYL